MKSKAHLKSHPIHPFLIPFPIAFFLGTFISDGIGRLLTKADLLQTAYYLNIAGIVMAILAAIPGLIDYIYTVPPNSSAKSRGAKHGIMNTLVLCLFIGAFFYRQQDEVNTIILLSIETIAIALMMIAGWMGGTLVHRNQIGIDIRYAHAGKWQEAYFHQNEGSIEVAAADELKVNAMKLLHVNKKRIVLARTENGFRAFDDRCTHRGGSLAGGSIMCGTVQCPWHGSQFSVDNGQVSAGPAKQGITTYEVQEKDGKVFLHL